MKKIQIEKLSDLYETRRLVEADVPMLYAWMARNDQYYRYCGGGTTPDHVRQDLTLCPPGIPLAQKHYVGFFEEDTLIAIMDLIDGYPNANTAFIGFFMMNKDLQGQGTGTAIIRDVLIYLAALGYTAVRLGIDKENPQSNHFWRKNGFAVLKEVPQARGVILLAERRLSKDHMDPWTQLAVRVQAIAQAGLTYGENAYDRERYAELRTIAAQMLAVQNHIPARTIEGIFAKDVGYQTPKVDTRVAVFQDGKILLVHEKNGTWSLPGGWCDADQSVASNAVKETKEEAGLDVTAEKLIAVQDWRKHNQCNLPYGVVKIFVECRVLGGAFAQNIETTETKWFARHNLPTAMAVEKCTAEQVQLCFDANETENWQTQFE